MKLENKTVEELKNMCRNKKISGYSKLNKQGLVNLLNNNKKVKKGGTDYDLSFKNLKVGKYYKCDVCPYKNKYSGKLINISDKYAVFHRLEHPDHPDHENLYGTNTNNIDYIYRFKTNTHGRDTLLFTELTHQEVENLGCKVWFNNNNKLIIKYRK